MFIEKAAWKLYGVLHAKCQSVSARRSHNAGFLGDKTSNQAVLYQTLIGLWWSVCLCMFVSTKSRFVSLFPLFWVKIYTVRPIWREKQDSKRGLTLIIIWMHFVSRQRASAKQGGLLFPLPELERCVGRASTWCCSFLAQFSKSLAPQTLQMASSLLGPYVLASQQPLRNQAAEIRWKDTIQKCLIGNLGPIRLKLAIVLAAVLRDYWKCMHCRSLLTIEL